MTDIEINLDDIKEMIEAEIRLEFLKKDLNTQKWISVFLFLIGVTAGVGFTLLARLLGWI